MITLCAECGPGVRVDEDGCCLSCGATASGAWLDAFFNRTDALELASLVPPRGPPTEEETRLISMCDELAGAKGYSNTWRDRWRTYYIPAILACAIDDPHSNGSTMRSCLETCHKEWKARQEPK